MGAVFDMYFFANTDHGQACAPCLHRSGFAHRQKVGILSNKGKGDVGSKATCEIHL